MMSENIARNMYSSQGIINYPTQLHLVGHFRILCHDARKHEYQDLSCLGFIFECLEVKCFDSDQYRRENKHCK